MSYDTQHALTSNETFLGRVKQAIVQYAGADVIPEDGGTAHHDARVTLARAVLSEPNRWASVMVHFIVVDETINDQATDVAMFSRVAAIWNEYAAGVP